MDGLIECMSSFNMRGIIIYLSIMLFAGLCLATPPHPPPVKKPNDHHGYYHHTKKTPPHPKKTPPHHNSKHVIHGDKYHSVKKVLCPQLPSPDYGHVEITGLYPTDKAIYTCKPGYNLIGPKVRTCLYTGEWDKKPPICRVIDCGPLPNISHGHVVIHPDTTLGGIASYYCDNKYKLIGTSTRKCLSNGKWYGKEPKCVYYYTEPPTPPKYKDVPCGKLAPPKYGKIEVHGYKAGQEAFYYCKDGFKLVGIAIRKCLRYGRWSGEAPICKRINCGPLPNIANGQVSVSPDTRLGSTASYKCNTGFKLVGYKTRLCQKDGSWSNAEPTCSSVMCGYLPHPVNGRVQLVPDDSFQSQAIYKCAFGYTLNGQEVRYCMSNSQWSGIAPTCQRVKCNPPPVSDPNGSSKVNGTQVGDAAFYSCNSGYILKGCDTITCLPTGRWSDTAPVCVAVSCGAPDPPDPNGSIQIDGIMFGDVVQYKCNKGYVLVGSRTATCQSDGEWSNSAPSCQPVSCGPLTSPKGGYVYFYPDTSFTSVATFICEFGLKLVGSRVRTCQSDGTWSGTQPTCKELSCPKIDPPHYGKINVSGYYPGDVIHYECAHGYKLVGKPVIKCLYNGEWSGPPSDCVKDSYYKYHQAIPPPLHPPYHKKP